MKRKVVGFLMCIMMVISLAGCSSKEASKANTSETKEETSKTESTEKTEETAKDDFVKTPELVLVYAENQADDYPTSKGAYYFADLLYEKTKGRIAVTVQTGGVLGDEKSVLEQLQYGGLDMTRASLSAISGFNQSLDALQLPYLYRNADHMWKVLNGEIGEKFLNSFEGTDLVALSWYDAGARNFYNSVREIKTLADMQGLNIRVQESSLMMGMVEALGANPTPMTYSEVYSGLQTGVIDGAENNWPSYYSTSHYEVAKYITVDEHTRVPELQIISQKTWDKLSDEDKATIKECAIASADYEKELWAEYEKESYDAVIEAGCTVTELSEEEYVKFQDACKGLYEKFAGDYMDIVNAIIATE